MKKHLYAVMPTSTNGMDNHVPYVVAKIDIDASLKRIEDVKAMTGEGGAASVSFWSDKVMEIEWLEELPSKWLDDMALDLLDRTGLVYTQRSPPDDWDGKLARVEASMSVFWDHTFGVRCEDRYADGVWYEGAVISYEGFIDLCTEWKKKGKKR